MMVFIFSRILLFVLIFIIIRFLITKILSIILIKEINDG